MVVPPRFELGLLAPQASVLSIELWDDGAGGWTRTNELRRGEIYSLLQLPLCDSSILAESRGFEPLVVLPTPVFKTGALSHYANSPMVLGERLELSSLSALVPKTSVSTISTNRAIF